MQNYTLKYIYTSFAHTCGLLRVFLYIIRYTMGKEKGCVKWIRIRYGQKG